MTARKEVYYSQSPEQVRKLREDLKEKLAKEKAEFLAMIDECEKAQKLGAEIEYRRKNGVKWFPARKRLGNTKKGPDLGSRIHRCSDFD